MKKQVIKHPSMPDPYGAYSTVIRAGDFIFVSGQAGIDPETGAKVGEDFEVQARQALRTAVRKSATVAAG